MKECINCGKQIKDEDRFCMYCGASQHSQAGGEQGENPADNAQINPPINNQTEIEGDKLSLQSQIPAFKTIEENDPEKDLLAEDYPGHEANPIAEGSPAPEADPEKDNFPQAENPAGDSIAEEQREAQQQAPLCESPAEQSVDNPEDRPAEATPEKTEDTTSEATPEGTSATSETDNGSQTGPLSGDCSEVMPDGPEEAAEVGREDNTEEALSAPQEKDAPQSAPNGSVSSEEAPSEQNSAKENIAPSDEEEPKTIQLLQTPIMAEKKAESKKKKKAFPAVFMVILLLLAAVGVYFGYPYIVDYSDYKAGTSAFESGDYATAESYLAPLSEKDYKQSALMMEYIKGKNQYEAKEYMAAYDIFTHLGEYMDSAQCAEDCLAAQYELALEKTLEGDYQAAEDAADAFNNVSYGESGALLLYLEGRGYMEEGRYYEAMKVFEGIDYYLDSAQLAADCVRPAPATGIVYRNPNHPSTAVSLKISVPEEGYNYFIKLHNSSEELVATVFIASGKSVTINIPAATYTFKEATGTKWYGPLDMFGDEGYYYIMKFDDAGTTAYALKSGASYTLTIGVSQGNVSNKSVDREAF